MPSKEAERWNQLFQSFPKDPPGTPHDYAAERAANASRPLPPPPQGVRVEPVCYDGVDGEIVQPDEPNGSAIWYIHGGGLTTGSARERRELTFHLAEKYACTVVASNYRLAPENRWPAQQDDCMTFYRAMLANGFDPKRLFFMGESAGGMLVLSVALRARDEGLPLPAGIAAFSPGTGVFDEFPSHTTNIPTDYMLGDALTRQDQNIAVFGTTQPSDAQLRHPYYAPFFGDFNGLPPIFLSASDYEVLLDDAVRLHDKLVQEGHLTAIDVAHGVLHAYPIFPDMPEAQETIDNAVRFLLHPNVSRPSIASLSPA